MNDKFIILDFKESRKTRFIENKPIHNIANYGANSYSKYFVDRNGEYSGIIIEIQEKMFPLFFSHSVHQIYLNIETDYENNMLIIQKFGLENLYQKYNNNLFCFIVDYFLELNNLQKIYNNYPNISSNIHKDFELKNLIKQIDKDIHSLIDVPIKVISCGSLLPEEWIGKIFENGEKFHKSIDLLEERINKPPVTYLANYGMMLLQENIPNKFCSEMYNDNTWIQSQNDFKFYKNKALINKDIQYCYLEFQINGQKILLVFNEKNTWKQKPTFENNSIGFNASLLQKSIRRGSIVYFCLEEAINNLANAKPYNNPEHNFELVSSSRQLCWRLFISIIEETCIYHSDKLLDIFDLVAYSYIYKNFPNHQIHNNLLEKVKETAYKVQDYTKYLDFNRFKEGETNPVINYNSRYETALYMSLKFMPGMKGDKRMISCLLTWIKRKPKLPNLEVFVKPMKLNPVFNKITWFSSIDHHCSPTILNQIHNAIYDGKTTLMDCSANLWNHNSVYNYRKGKFSWYNYNDLFYIIQYFVNKNDTKIFSCKKLYENDTIIKTIEKPLDIYDYEFIWINERFQDNLLNYEFMRLKLEREFIQLKPTKFDYEHKLSIEKIGQIILSNQYQNNFWHTNKKIIPIFTNNEIKFKMLDEIIDIESDYDKYVKLFNAFIKSFNRTITINNSIFANKNFIVKIENNNNYYEIKINNIICAKIDNYKIIWLSDIQKLLKEEKLELINLSKDSYLHSSLEKLIKINKKSSSTELINNYLIYRGLLGIGLKSNQIVNTDIIKLIDEDIIRIILGRILTALEDKSENTTLILGKIDRSGKASGDAVDELHEGYLMRIMNILCLLFGCFQRVNEYKFIIKTKSKVFKYFLDKISINQNIIFNKNNKTINTNIKIIKTPLWTHQKRVKDMVIEGIKIYKQRGFGDASNVGSGKTLTALSMIESIYNLESDENAKKNLNKNYLILVPNTNLYDVWKDEINKHCVKTNYSIQESNGKWINNKKNSDENNINIFITTMGRSRDNPLNSLIDFVVIDECLTVQNKESKWTIRAFEQVVKSKFGVIMLSATFFRTRFDKLFFMLKMLNTDLPTKSEYLDTILNISIGANIKSGAKEWNTTIHKIQLDKGFYKKYNSLKLDDKKESYIGLQKYMGNSVNWITLFIEKGLELLKQDKKVLLYVESENQLNEFRLKVENDKIKNICFYPEIDKDICVISNHKGTYGINNLIKYNTIMMKPPEPDKLPQIKGRLDRPNQTANKLFIEYIIIKDTIDEIDLISLELANNFYNKHIIPLANYYEKYA
jgi:hypothetical protein